MMGRSSLQARIQVAASTSSSSISPGACTAKAPGLASADEPRPGRASNQPLSTIMARTTAPTVVCRKPTRRRAAGAGSGSTLGSASLCDIAGVLRVLDAPNGRDLERTALDRSGKLPACQLCEAGKLAACRYDQAQCALRDCKCSLP